MTVTLFFITDAGLILLMVIGRLAYLAYLNSIDAQIAAARAERDARLAREDVEMAVKQTAPRPALRLVSDQRRP